MLNNQLVLGIDRDLHVIGNNRALTGEHRAAVRIRERNLGLPTLRKGTLDLLMPGPACSQAVELALQGCGRGRGSLSLVLIPLIQFAQIGGDLLVKLLEHALELRLSEVALAAVDR